MYVSRPVLRFEARPKTCVHESTVLCVQLCWQFIGDRSFAHISVMLLWFSLASSAPVYSLVRFVPKGVQKRLTIKGPFINSVTRDTGVEGERRV